MYYAYATQGAATGDGGGAMRNIQLARSHYLARWDLIGDALPVNPARASRTQDFWAPHVIGAAGSYVMYDSAKPDSALADAA